MRLLKVLLLELPSSHTLWHYNQANATNLLLFVST